VAGGSKDESDGFLNAMFYGVLPYLTEKTEGNLQVVINN